MVPMENWSFRMADGLRRIRRGSATRGKALLGLAVPLAVAALIFGNFAPGPKSHTGAQQIAARAYAVYDASLSRYLKGVHGYVIIGDFTSSFRCGTKAKNGFQMGGCGGMRAPVESPRLAIDSVRGSLQGLRKSAITDFLGNNARAFPLARKFILPVKYVLYGPHARTRIPKQWGAPAYAFYLSRVGFSANGKQALVFVNYISWKNRSLSGGAYLLLERKAGQWTVRASKTFWSLKR